MLVDIHCHCLPGLDDGPADRDESLALCEALVEDGFSTVVASPHQLGRYEGVNTRGVILEAVVGLRSLLEQQGVPLSVYPGADVRIDDQLGKRVAGGNALTIADARKYLLLELPHVSFVDPIFTFRELAGQGVTSVLTHPERYRYLGGKIEPIEAWRAEGAAIQVTAGSLLGDFGRSAFAFGWRLVRSGLVDVIATDAHDATHRRPRMRAARERLEFEVGKAETDRLCYTNPWRIFNGEPIATSGDDL